MMNSIYGMASVLVGVFWLSIASADVIHCQFTEPYVDYAYNTSTATLVVNGLDVETKTFNNVGLDVMAPNRLRLTWKDGVEQVLDLTVDYQGSDLMSDHVFPYSARFYVLAHPDRVRQGGCSSNHLKMIIPIDPPE